MTYSRILRICGQEISGLDGSATSGLVDVHGVKKPQCNTGKMAQVGRHPEKLLWRGGCEELVPNRAGIVHFESVRDVGENFGMK